ncbi:hypothetical protein C8Q78DRAFT_1099000 [Trametes maxima]|nr:hypothetical protein C8Q78DRAFT_1099000 [Trametes maxima]
MCDDYEGIGVAVAAELSFVELAITTIAPTSLVLYTEKFTSNAQMVNYLSGLTIGNYCNMSTEALLIYYYITTLHHEVQCLQSPKNFGFYIFMTGRYIPLVVQILNTPFFGAPSSQIVEQMGCKPYLLLGQILEYSQDLIWAGLRAYGLCQKKVWSLIIFLFSISPFLVNLLALYWQTIYIDPNVGCTFTRSVPIDISKSYSAVIIITWSTQYKSSQQSHLLGNTVTLSAVLFRNGNIYFIPLVALNTLQMILSFLSILNLTQGFQTGFISIFIAPITAILVSMFLIDLRDAASSKSRGSESLSSIVSLRLDFIGATLPDPRDPSVLLDGLGSATEREDLSSTSDNAIELEEAEFVIDAPRAGLVSASRV